MDLLQWARAISSQVQAHGLMCNLEEVRQDQKKRTVSVFVVDKRSRKIVKPAKDMVLHLLSNLGVKVQAIIAGSSYAFWDILLPTEDEAVALTCKTLENKEYFFRTEYMGRRRTTVSVYNVPSFLRDANLVVFMLNFGDIISATHDRMHGEWRFDIMLDAKDLLLHSQLVGCGRVQASGDHLRTQTCLLALQRDWSPLCSLPGEEGPEKARPESRYPPTCCNKYQKGGSHSLAHIGG